MSPYLAQMLDLGGAALHGVELAEDVGRFLGDRVSDVGEHARAFFSRGVLRAAEPAGRRDRADVGQDRLKTAGAAQLVHLMPVRVVGRIVDAVEMDEAGFFGEHRERLDLAPIAEPVPALPANTLAPL